ncbi:GspH/FimT family pseudopilin [Pseudoalteromonas piscicida]|uniref:Type II secretion system protein H n=1 Tax=Pseudoalteromonas piscicida TaxID=43662 RepID=A0A2A5JVH6_PSEO7|nr:GspH/FimT family pseudopilin [Pseudoalteromonas piscicida]PCK33445.1 type II secretion system protein GspH [Pseudoalteromonas piscicida]
MSVGNKRAGFTLLELLIAMAILAILAAIAAPSFIKQIQQDRITTHANELQAIFRLARSEAVKREQQVSLVVEDGDWVVKTNENGQLTEVSRFTIKHSSIEVALTDQLVRESGEVLATNNILITDKITDTQDYRLCVLVSGQSWLAEAEQNCS